MNNKLKELLEDDKVAFKLYGSNDWKTGIIDLLLVEGIPLDNGFVPEETELTINSEDELVYLTEIRDIILLERDEIYE